MLKADDKQFSVSSDGQVLYQPTLNNPLPGQAVGVVSKGTSLLSPAVTLLDNGSVEEAQKEATLERLNKWMGNHVQVVLDALVKLPVAETENVPSAVSGISSQIHAALGIAPREQLEELIATLDQDGRRLLRHSGIKLGPVLVFMPALNKPAAVRLRALLWNLWNDKPLPADVPPDGVTSLTSVGKDADPLYYRSIGYPVYGPRLVRVDMLDRVINAVYEQADKGQFKARHEMAEWLGCSIPDLYAVLEAMGHKKIHDPEDEKVAKIDATETAPEEKAKAVEEVKADEPKAEDEVAPDVEVKTEETAASETEKKEQPSVKPELATFRLRKGKAYGGASAATGRPEREKKKDRDKKKSFKKPSHQKGKHKSDKPRVMSSGPERKLENSPFAMLKDLKVGKDG